MRNALVIRSDGLLVRLTEPFQVSEAGIWFALAHVLGGEEPFIPLERVVGVYATSAETDADLIRARREADAYGDARGLPHPMPIVTLRLVVTIAGHLAPRTDGAFVYEYACAFGTTDAYTRQFFKRRPVFLARLVRIAKSALGNRILPHLTRMTIAESIAREIERMWPESNYTVDVKPDVFDQYTATPQLPPTPPPCPSYVDSFESTGRGGDGPSPPMCARCGRHHWPR